MRPAFKKQCLDDADATTALAASEIDKVELTCTRAQIVTFLFSCLGD